MSFVTKLFVRAVPPVLATRTRTQQKTRQFLKRQFLHRPLLQNTLPLGGASGAFMASAFVKDQSRQAAKCGNTAAYWLTSWRRTNFFYSTSTLNWQRNNTASVLGPIWMSQAATNTGPLACIHCGDAAAWPTTFRNTGRVARTSKLKSPLVPQNEAAADLLEDIELEEALQQANRVEVAALTENSLEEALERAHLLEVSIAPEDFGSWANPKALETRLEKINLHLDKVEQRIEELEWQKQEARLFVLRKRAQEFQHKMIEWHNKLESPKEEPEAKNLHEVQDAKVSDLLHMKEIPKIRYSHDDLRRNM